MLPAPHRLTDPAGFRRASRRGVRSGSRTLVVHLADHSSPGVFGADRPAVQVGFVVSKAVGNAVVRNRVKRRLRYAVGQDLAGLPAGATVVVRAQAPAATATYSELREDLERCVMRVMERRAEVMQR